MIYRIVIILGLFLFNLSASSISEDEYQVLKEFLVDYCGESNVSVDQKVDLDEAKLNGDLICKSDLSLGIEPLSVIEQVTGSVILDSFVEFTPTSLNLREVGRDISLSGVNSAVALSYLESVGGSLNLSLNKHLVQIDALSRLNYVGGDLVLKDMDLESIEGLISLTTVGGTLDISWNEHLESIKNGLSQLISIGKNFYMNNCNLERIDGLATLHHIGGDFDYSSNLELRSVASKLENLTISDVEGTVYHDRKTSL